MERLTRAIGKENYVVENDKVKHTDEGYTGHAIDKLAKFEDIYESLEASQIEISKELEKLRNEGKKNSVKFRELMGKKLMNSYALNLFKLYDLG